MQELLKHSLIIYEWCVKEDSKNQRIGGRAGREGSERRRAEGMLMHTTAVSVLCVHVDAGGCVMRCVVRCVVRCVFIACAGLLRAQRCVSPAQERYVHHITSPSPLPSHSTSPHTSPIYPNHIHSHHFTRTLHQLTNIFNDVTCHPNDH